MRSQKKVIFVLILLLAIGFAAVTTTLVINGTSLFGTSEDDFVIIFTKAIVDGEDKSSEVISADGKTIIYTTSELAIKDDQSILDFTVKNTSTQYDAEVSIECIGGTNEGTYYKIEKSVADYIPAQTEDDGQVVVTMLKSSTEPIEEEFTCTVTATAVERDEKGDVVCSVDYPPTTCNEAGDVCWTDVDCSGNRSIGDVVSLGTEENSVEQFYIINDDGTNAKMISMYNLYVGDVLYDECPITTLSDAPGASSSRCIIPYENPTGIQDSTMLGLVSGTTHNGVTVFSSVEQKGENYSDYIGSIVEGYVNNYSDYLSNTLGVENTATLISKEELELIVDRPLYGGLYLSALGAPAFLYSTSYWTRSAYGVNSIYTVSSSGEIEGGVHYSYGSNQGVRPVITIATFLFEDEEPYGPEEPQTRIVYEDTDNSGTRNIGDIITISKEGSSAEQFYLLNDDGVNLQLMSRYNLYVGQEFDSGDWTVYENPTGIQDSMMMGWTSAGSSCKGVTAFSSVEVKGTNYSDYEGSIVEGYVNNYSKYISDTLRIENTATLISKEELEAIVGQTLSFGDLSTLGAPAFLYSTSYWTRSALNGSVVWSVLSSGYFNDASTFSTATTYGVRPVITIPTVLFEELSEPATQITYDDLITGQFL